VVAAVALALPATAAPAASPSANPATIPDSPPHSPPHSPRTDPGTAAWERVPRDRVAAECGMDPDLLEQADLLLAPRAYTVVRHGKLCWEARHTDEVYHVASVTKTLGALMVGVAASRSSLSDEDRLDRWVDLSAWPLVNPDATLAHALSMTAFNPVLDYPAKRWLYDVLGDREIDTLMDAVDAVIAAEPAAFPGIGDRVDLVQRELFDKLGMGSSRWVGETLGFSMDSTPRDLARLGLLIGRRGAYNGEQLIDPEYMHRMTHPAFEDANTGYGYLTQMNADLNWFYSTGTNDLLCSPTVRWSHYPHRPFFQASSDHGGNATRGEQPYDVGVVWASGAGGQRIVVHRALDLVMTIRDEASNEGHKTVWNAIRPALVAEDPVFRGDEVAFCEAYRNSEYAPNLLPDLTVAVPTATVEGDSVRLSAVVSNPGEQRAADVAVRFLVDGTAVVADQVVTALPFGGAVTVTAPLWRPPAGGATHTVRVIVDPDDVIAEEGGAPNEATTTIAVPAAGRSVQRHAGTDRVATAVAVSGAGLERADTVVIARADDPADALAGAPLAAHLGAPLLLSRGDRLSAATAREVRRLGATQAILLGGPAALGDRVADDLRSITVEVRTVRRVAGPNRWATAAAIAAELPAGDEVFVVRGDRGGFADAVSVSGLAATAVRPILLTEPGRLPTETAEAVPVGGRAVIIGGHAAVGADVERALAARATVRRLAGATRYATSAAVAAEALSRGAILPGSLPVAWVATGVEFPDGLVAGPAAARDGGLLVLVDGRDLGRSPETLEVLAAQQPRAMRVAGGTAAVSSLAHGQLVAVLR
jgi:putative cell wall-binding protein